MTLPIENPQAQIEKDIAARRAAKDAKKDSFPVDPVEVQKAGNKDGKEEKPKYTPEEAEEIKKIAHYISERRMAGDNDGVRAWQKELAKEYGLNDEAFSKETIEKLLSENGLGDKQWTPEAQKFMQDWDWGKAEEIFRNMKKAGEQTPDQDTESKTSASPDKTPMGDVLKKQSTENQRQIDNKAAEDERIADLEKQQQNRNIEAEAEQGDLSQAELNKAITDFEAKQAQIAEMRAKKGGRWASLRKTLGFKEKNIDTDPEVMVLEDESKSLYRDLMSKGIHLYKGDKPQLENFLRQFDEFESFRNVRNQELDKKGEVAGFPENILAGLHTLTKKWSELNWKQKIAISVGGGLLVAGGAMALGAGTFGAATLGLGYRWGFRVFGAAAAGVGRNVMLDRQMMTEMQNEAEARLKERMDNIEKYENNLDQGIEEMLNKSGISNVRKDFEQRRTANELRALKFARNTFIVSIALGETFRYASEAMGGLSGIKDSAAHFLSGDQISAEGMGGGTVATQAQEAMSAHTPEVKMGGSLQNWAESTHAAGAYPEGKVGLVGYGSETGGHDLVDAHPEGKYGPNFSGSEASGHEFVAAHPEGKYGPGLYGSEGEGHIPDTKPNFIEEARISPAAGAYPEGKVGLVGYGSETGGHDLVDAHPEGKYGPNFSGSEASGHEFVAAHPEGKYGPGLYGSEGEGHIPDMRDIASVKIKAGGSMWGSIENNIKANPSAYGLDPKAPGFTKDMHRMTQQMLDEFAYRKGMSYEQLDQIARTKIRAGDTFKIIYNPSTEEIYLDDFHGKAFGADVSHGGAGAAAQEAVPSKPNVSVDDVKPKAGVAPDEVKPRTGAGAAERHPARGAGKTMQYESDTPDQINAKKDFALADKYQKDLRAFNAQETARLEGVNEMANDQLFSSTKEGMERIFHESGISIRANILDKPMNAWGKLIATENYISQDVQDADAVGKMNININKLKNLRLILGRYNTSGSETIGDCLKQAVKNPTVLRLINKVVL